MRPNRMRTLWAVWTATVAVWAAQTAAHIRALM